MTEVIRGKVGCGLWSKWHQRWERINQFQPNSIIQLRFEDVVSAPLKVSNLIKDLIGLDFNRDAKLTSFEKLQRRNPDYFRAGNIDKSKHYYTAKEISLIQKLHGSTARQLGYE